MAKKDEDKSVTTVTTTDRDGNEFEVEVGVDGKNPVSVNNPPAKAVSVDDAEVIKEELAKVEERQEKLQSDGSDGPGNDHNKDGIATFADKRQGSGRPTTAAGTGQEQHATDDKSDAKK